MLSGSIDELVKVIMEDKELKKFPEFEEFRTGDEYKASEVINFERLEEDEDVKALVNAARKEKVKDETDETDEFEKIKTQLLRKKLEGVATKDIEVKETGLSDRDETINSVHTYIDVTNPTLYRKLNNRRNEADVRASRSVTWRRNLIIKETDNILLKL